MSGQKKIHIKIQRVEMFGGKINTKRMVDHSFKISGRIWAVKAKSKWFV
jgi:hypothetical protein